MWFPGVFTLSVLHTMAVNITIHVIAALSGERIQSLCVPNTLGGYDLLEVVLAKQVFHPGCAVRLVYRHTQLNENRSLAAQDIIHGVVLALLWVPISDAERDAAVGKLMASTPDKFTDAEKEALRSVSALEWHAGNLNNIVLLQGLKVLRFAPEFNSSLDDVTLPCGLLILLLGDSFNQSLDGATLPSGLQCLHFSADFNQSLDRATLPSGIEYILFSECYNLSLIHI